MVMTPMIERTADKVVDHTPRCWRCSRVLIDYCTRPWGGLICKKCKTKNNSTPLRCTGCGYMKEDGQPCSNCSPALPGEHIEAGQDRPLDEETLWNRT